MTSKKRDLIPREREDPSNPNVIEVIYEERQAEEDEEDHTCLPPPQKTRTVSRIGDEVDDVLFGGVAPRSSRSYYSNPSSSFGDAPRPPPQSALYSGDAGTPFDFFDFEAMKRHLQRQVEWMTSDVAALLGGIQMHTNRPMSELILNGTFFNGDARNLDELHSTSGLNAQILGPMLAQLAISMLTLRVLGTTPLPQTQQQGSPAPDLTPTPRGSPAFSAFETILDDPSSLAFKVEDNGEDNGVLLVSPTRVAAADASNPGVVFAVPTTPDNARRIFGQTLGSKDTPSKMVEMTVPPPQRKLVRSMSLTDLRNGINRDEVSVSVVRKAVKPQVLFPAVTTTITSNIGLSFDHESAVHMIQRMRQSVQPIGDDAQRQNDLVNKLQSIIGQAAQGSTTERWLWNQMPENSGITAVAPDVKAAIAEAFENIRALPGKSHIKLIHLIRSPRVREKFAAYVASLMNVVPGMMAYQSGVSGRGRASYRVSSGYAKEARDARLSRAGLIWFETVGYSQDPNIASANQKISAASSKLDRALQDANRTIDVLLRAKEEAWGAIAESTQNHAYVQRLYENKRQEKYEVWARTKVRADKELARTEVERYDKMLRWFVDQELNRLPPFEEGLSRALTPYLWTWLSVFGWAERAPPPQTTSGLVYPDHQPEDPVGAINPATQNWTVQLIAIPSLVNEPRNYARLSATLELSIQETSKAVRDTSLWSNDAWRRMDGPHLRRVVDSMVQTQSAIKKVDVLVKEHLEATQLIAGLTEDDRVVLVKNGDSRSRHRSSGRTQLLIEGSYMPLVATAETMEGYFPRSINLLDNYELMNLRRY